MPAAKEAEPKTKEEVPSTPAAELVTDEMRESAEASARVRTQEQKRSGAGVRRKQGGGRSGATDMRQSDIPYPVEAHGEDFEFYGPMGAAAVIPSDSEVAAYSAEQEFIIDPERVKTLSFDKPGRNLPAKRLYNIKAIHKDGRLVQLPFEAQVQNNAGGDPEDAIGLRRYQRKGITLLIDWDTMRPVYCSAWDCWAQAAQDGNFVGFCSLRHAQHTLPNAYKGGSEIARGLMEAGVTTTNVWST